MASLASILPFLSALKKAQPDFSGMTSDNEIQPPPAPEPDVAPPPLQMPQQQAPAPQVTQQQPGDVSGIGALTQVPQQDQGAPKLAGETKGHKLLRILMGAGYGAAAGAGQRTFGEGFQQSQMLPLQIQHQQLQNQAALQTLPFLRQAQIAGIQKNLAEAGKSTAEGQKAQAEVQGMPIKQALEQAQTEAANYKDDPNLGLIDLRNKQPVNPAGFAPLTADEARVLGKQPGDRVPLKLKNIANEIAMRGITNVTTEQGVFERNRQSGTMTRLGDNPRMMFAPSERFVPVADPSNPGNVLYRKAGEAAAQNMSSPQSATTQAAKAVTKSAVAGKIGDEINAFNTALAHADLLRQAARALNNGDQRTLAGLSNRLETEFGDARLTDFHAIANAYAREVTKMLSGGHMTDNEIKDQGATLPSNANYKTIDSVIGKYEALARSKMQQRQKQVERGQRGEANFPTAQEPTATGPNGHKIAYRNGVWVDAAPGQPVQ